MPDDLKNKANPNYGLINEVAVTNERLDTLIVLLGALCDSNDVIVTYKEEQKQGDITYRKKSNRQGWAGVIIALVAVYISIRAYSGSFLALIGGV